MVKNEIIGSPLHRSGFWRELMRGHHSVRGSYRVGNVKQLRRRAEGSWQFRGDKVWQSVTLQWFWMRLITQGPFCSRLSHINLNMWSLWFSLQQIRQIIFVFHLLSWCSSPQLHFPFSMTCSLFAIKLICIQWWTSLKTAPMLEYVSFQTTSFSCHWKLKKEHDSGKVSLTKGRFLLGGLWFSVTFRISA